MKNLHSLEIGLPPEAILYRARVGFCGSAEEPRPYEETAIGAPPREAARPGRANRGGQSVVYCAEEEDTAVYEVRPSRGIYVSVGELHATQQLRITDLCAEIPEPNPFLDEALNYNVELRGLFIGLGNALAEPMRRTDDESHYLPTQALSERIQAAGFHGIRYPSAMRKGGYNIVIFDPTHIRVKPSSWLVEIESIEITYGPPDLEQW